MTPSLIATLIIAVVVALVIIAFIAQSIENNRKERHLQALALQAQTRQARSILTDVPHHYLPGELRKLLYAYLAGRYKEILALEPNNLNASSQLQTFEDLMKESAPPAETTQQAFSDHLSAQAARHRLKQLVDLIIEMNNQGLLDRTGAQNYINQGKTSYKLLSTDINLLTAKKIESSGNPTLALTHYLNCRASLKTLNTQNQLDNKIQKIEETIKELQLFAKTEAADKDHAIQAQAQQDDAWNELTDSDSHWKIKQEYEK